MASTALATVSRTGRSPVIGANLASIDYDMLERQVAKVAGGNSSPFPGKQLSFNGQDGEWAIGFGDNKETFEGDAFVVLFHQVAHGFVKYAKGSGPQWKFLINVADPTAEKAVREDCGDNDESQWDVDDDGKPQDPWKECLIVMVRDGSGEMFHLLADTVSKRISVGGLLSSIYRQGKAKPGMLPLVEFGVEKKKSKDGKRSFKVPSFDIAEWQKPSAEDMSPVAYEAAGDELDDEDDAPVATSRAPAPAPKEEAPSRRTRGAPAPADVDEEEAPAPSTTRRTRGGAAAPQEAPAPSRRTRGAAAPADDNDADAEARPAFSSQRRRRG